MRAPPCARAATASTTEPRRSPRPRGCTSARPYYQFNSYFPLPFRPLTLDDPFPSDFPIQLPPPAYAMQRDLRRRSCSTGTSGSSGSSGPTRVAEIAYVGSRGSRLLTARDLNQPRPEPQPAACDPIPAFDEIISSNRRAVRGTTRCRRAFEQRAGGLTLLGAYTFGKSLDDGSGFFPSAGDPNFPQDSRNPGAEYGRSAFDVRHRSR